VPSGQHIAALLPVLLLAGTTTFCGAFASSNNDAPPALDAASGASDAGSEAGPAGDDAAPEDAGRDTAAPIPDAGVDTKLPPPPCGTHALAFSDDFSTLAPTWTDEGYPTNPPTGSAVLDVGRLRLTRDSGFGIIHRRTATVSLEGLTWLEVRLSVNLDGAFATDSLMFFQLSADGAGADYLVRLAVQGGSVFLQDVSKSALGTFARPSGPANLRFAVTFLAGKRHLEVTLGGSTASLDSLVLPAQGALRMLLAAFSDYASSTGPASVLFDDLVVCTAPP
jgi:hypothetical protein